MKTIAGIIHARKDSTRCPNKHLRPLGNTTLIDVALDKLSKLDLDEKYLAVHDQELKDKVIDGVKILHREYDSVAPGNSPHNIMYKHLENVESDYIVNINPCQPFLKIEELQQVITKRATPSDINKADISEHYSTSKDEYINILDMDLIHLIRSYSKNIEPMGYVPNTVENLREKLDTILTNTYSARELLDKS